MSSSSDGWRDDIAVLIHHKIHDTKVNKSPVRNFRSTFSTWKKKSWRTAAYSNLCPHTNFYFTLYVEWSDAQVLWWTILEQNVKCSPRCQGKVISRYIVDFKRHGAFSRAVFRTTKELKVHMSSKHNKNVIFHTPWNNKTIASYILPWKKMERT